MKFVLAFSSILALVSAEAGFRSESAIGKHLMTHARRLNNNQNEAVDDSWISGYSIKFQGCHSIKQWNAEAEGEDDVKISSKSLVRFRLCPSDSCSAAKGKGCSSGYGEYVVDMPTFLQSWWEASRQDIEYGCWSFLNTQCSCNNDDQADGADFNEEYCQYDCFNAAGKTECIDRNPYEEENGNNNNNKEEFNVEDYMACKELKVQNNNRRLADQEEVKYYVGPECMGQGGSIHLGLFTDESCTVAADESVSFTSLMGYELPYSSTSLVQAECVSCLEHKEEDNKNQQEGGEADADQVSDACEQLYVASGKCEQNYEAGMVASPNTNACTYMEGIKIVSSDGYIYQAASKPSKVATSFIVIFALAFAGMAFYVHYLRTRLGTKKNTLL